MTLLDLVYALRLRLDDTGGDVGAPPTGYTHYFEYDDSGCLFNNDELTRYLNEAEKEFCRRNPIIDAEIFRLYLYPNISTYDLEPQILSVQRVYSTARGVDICKTFYAEAAQSTLFPPASYYLENLHTRKIQFLTTPVKAEELQLTVQRLPLEPLLWAQRKTQEPEISPPFHSALIDYACFLAYQKRDSNTSAPALSMDALAMFERAVGPSKSATDLEWTRNLANRRPRARAQFV